MIVAPAFAQENPILQRMQAFANAYNAQDAAGVSAFYTEKGAILPPRSKPVVGRNSIARHYAEAFEGGVSDLKYRVLEIEQVGPATAIEIGETQVKFKEQTISGRYLHVWTNVNGTWSISRDMYHVLGVTK
ncbi:MAG: SgcJ/EcaC family oxidoreductase [Hyphomicrobiales bacterium]|nr:SgcJ/EcaC family oxidoreductase [Hyphomicrobiales bacterium]